jgi:hypothetical protein
MRRRVGSASAAKVRFSVLEEYLTIWLTINTAALTCKLFSRYNFETLSERTPVTPVTNVDFTSL